MGGKDEAPEGPDWKKLMKDIQPFIDRNQDLFKEAMSFGKDQFAKGEEFVQKLTDFGMDARGRLNTEAAQFEEKVGERVGALDKFGREWGKGISDVYGKNQALADKITGKLMPGMGTSAELGGTLLDRYSEAGIPLQDEYIAKLREWGSPAQQEAQAGMAAHDIAMATEAAREGEMQKLAQYGIDPSQTRAASLDARLQAQAAVAKAVAANTARQRTRAEGLQTMGMASDVYNESLAAGRGLVESATGQAGAIADIARQPGADWLENLGRLGGYQQGVAGLEQAGGTAGFGMRQTAEQLGMAGLGAGAAQQNAASQYGSSVYDQATNINKAGAGMLSSAYGTGGQLNANDVARVEQNNKNSFGGFLQEVAGVAAPFVLSSIPGVGPAAAAAAGTAKAAGGGGAPRSATPWLDPYYANLAKGGAIPDSASPSKGSRTDDVPAMLTAGEFVFDEPTTRWFGEKHLRNMQAQAKKGLGIPENAAA